MKLSTLWRKLGFGGPLSAKQIAKSGQLAANPFAQPDVRLREMKRLLADGQGPALAGLIKRFSINAQGHIADEEEKRWLEGALGELGADAKGPLEAYIEQEDRLTYALTTYSRVVGEAAATDFFVDVLGRIGPGDHRRVEAKRQLLLALSPSVGQPAVQQVAAKHLFDHADDVAFVALELVERACTSAAVAETEQAALLGPMRKLVVKEDVSARLAWRAAEIWADAPATWLRLPAGEAAETQLSPGLRRQFVAKAGRVVRLAPSERDGPLGARDASH